MTEIVPITPPSGQRVLCIRHPHQPAGRCPECVREAVPVTIDIAKAKEVLRSAGTRRAEDDERRRREGSVQP